MSNTTTQPNKITHEFNQNNVKKSDQSSSFFDDQSAIPSEPHGSEHRFTETA